MSIIRKPSILLNVSLLRDNPHFRTVFIARLLSVMSLGLLTVAVPVQIQQMTGSPLQVGMAIGLGGAATVVGLLVGGVLADRFDRRTLILLARSTCGLGFAALAVNAFAPSPSLPVLYVLAVWDGFFGALGMTALMAAVPGLVGRENLAAAGALSMLTVRLGGVLSPALGGLIIVSAGIGWNYLLTALGTLATVIQLVRLPAMRPQGRRAEPPLRAMATGINWLVTNPVVGAVVLVGLLVNMAGAVRVLFPALAESAYGAGPSAAGLMYSAVPAGAMLGALTSNRLGHVRRPGLMLFLAGGASLGAVVALGAAGGLPLALLILAAYGYFSSIAALLQFTLVQKHTPDHLLGRVNSLWTAQSMSGDAVGAVGLGALARLLSPLSAIAAFGTLAVGAIAVMAGCFSVLRQLSGTDPEPALSVKEDEKPSCVPSG